MFDGELVYDYENKKYYVSNVKGQRLAVYVAFGNGRKYLIIKDDILTVGRKHYYIPYQMQT